MCEIHQGPGAETLPNQRPDICLQLTCPVTETTPCHAERTIYAIDKKPLNPPEVAGKGRAEVLYHVGLAHDAGFLDARAKILRP